MKNTKLHNAIANDLINNGQLIEAGFETFRIATIPANAPAAQHHDMRMAFMAGAQHLYGSIMNALDPGSEPTDADMRRLHMIDSELREIGKNILKELDKNASPIKKNN